MSKKLSLKLEELRVESFATADGEDARGTVHGRESASVATGDDPVCFTLVSECATECGPCTQWQSCRSNCYESCAIEC